MKFRVLLLALTILVSTQGFSQKDEQVVAEDYSRSAVTLKMLDYSSGKHRQKLRQVFKGMSVPAKFDDNSVADKVINSGLPENTNNKAKREAIKKKLEEEKVANNIIAKWFNRQDDGRMNMELIHKRGLYNAVDADVKKAEASKRGKAMLKDMGLKLLQKSYIVVVDYAKVRNHKELKIDDRHGWRTPLNVFLFRVKYNSEVEARLFEEMWVYSDDDPETAQKKKEKFDNFTFEVEYVMMQSNPVPLQRMQYDSDTDLGKFIPQKSDEQLFKELVAKGVSQSFFLLEKNHEDFRVKVPLHDRKPLQAKIGKKEGLKVDQRYFVYEYVYNEKKDETEPNRKGVIRAKKVVDNRQVATGEMPTSRFYQISGGSLKKGMLLQQKSDWGISIQGRYGIGEMGGGGIKVSYNTARIVGIPQLKLYGYASFDAKTYEISEDYLDEPDSEEYDFGFTRLGGGLAKGYYFARMFSLEPFVGIAYESASNSDLTFNDVELLSENIEDFEDDIDFNVIMFDVGADFGIHIGYWMKLIAGVEYHVVGDIMDSDGDSYTLETSEGDPVNYADFFDGREGVTFNLGIHIEF